MWYAENLTSSLFYLVLFMGSEKDLSLSFLHYFAKRMRIRGYSCAFLLSYFLKITDFVIFRPSSK